MSVSTDSNSSQQQQQQSSLMPQLIPMMLNSNSNLNQNAANLLQSEYFPDVLQHMSSDQCQTILDLLTQSTYSHLINKQGPLGGYTPLHWMCIKNEYDLIKFLIVKCNADVNFKANLGESPLFICIKNCNLYTIELLIEHGADLQHKDIYNRSLVHWCAYTGKVVLLYYFQKYHSINSMNDVDQFQQNALHIACASGFSDLIMYLINRGEIDYYAQDFNGNTCLHMAVKCGLGRICWIISQQNRGECARLIGMMNNQNQRPFDLIRNERGSQCGEKNDNFYNYSKPENGSLLKIKKGTFFLKWNSQLHMKCEWLFRFTCFFIVTALPVLLNKYLIYPDKLSLIKGLVGYSTFIGIFLLVIRQKHRISHISGLQNPYFIGFITSLFVHNYSTYYLHIFARSGYISIYEAIIAVLSIWHIYTYYDVVFAKPGFCKENFKKSDGTSYDLKDLMRINAKNPKGGKDSVNWLTDPPSFSSISEPSQLPQLYFCESCLIIQAIPTKHCKLCEGCCAKFDHHCLFIAKCVGLKNHKPFIVFLVSTLMCVFIFVYKIANYLFEFNEKLKIQNKNVKEDDQTDLVYFLFASTFHIWLTILAVVNIFMFFMVLFLFLYQMKFITLGYTSQFRPPIFFHKTNRRMASLLSAFKYRFENLYTFLFESCEINEELYFRNQKEYNSTIGSEKTIELDYPYPRDNFHKRNDLYPKDNFNLSNDPKKLLNPNLGNKQYEIDLD